MWQHKIPFLLHLIVEIPASLTFFFRPDSQLQQPQPFARSLIRQYGAALLSLNAIAAIFALRESDEVTGKVALAISIYHVAPTFRACSRILHPKEETDVSRAVLGGPILHLTAHITCAVMLSTLAFWHS